MPPRFTYGSFHRTALAALISCLFAGCVAEDLTDCPPAGAGDEAFVLRVTDLISGGDITSTAGVNDATLVVFDKNGGYVTRIDVAAGDVGRELALPAELLSRGAGETFHISAWGNLADNVAFREDVSAGDRPDSLFLKLRVNTEYLDNWYNPGAVFFGPDTITTGRATASRAGARVVHEVAITQKTARMAVTVRGLPANSTAGDYYFSMCEQNDGFTFEGTPLRINQWCKIRENGVFNSSGEFTTAEPYYVIPSIDPGDVTTCNAGVCLYKVGGGLTRRADAATRALTSDQAGYVTAGGDLNITGKAKVDSDGNHLALASGQTTNVLLTLSETGDLDVRVEMTGWDEIYQWNDW